MNGDPEREKLDAMAVRIRQAEGQPKGEPLDTAQPMKMSRVGFDFVGSVLVCVFLGWLIDREFKTDPWGIVTMVFVGFGAGIMSVLRLQKQSEGGKE